MDQPQVDPQVVSESVRIGIASLAGGMVRLFWRPVTTGTLFMRFSKVVWLLAGCVTCGFYATPVAVRWLEIDRRDSETVAFVAAVIGLIGLSLAGALLRAADGFEFKTWLRGVIGKEA